MKYYINKGALGKCSYMYLTYAVNVCQLREYLLIGTSCLQKSWKPVSDVNYVVSCASVQLMVKIWLNIQTSFITLCS